MNTVYPQMVDTCKPTICRLNYGPQFVNHHGMIVSDTEYVEIGQRLFAVRTGFSDLSQKDWALKHGFSPTQYNNWEKGTRRIPVEAAEKLSDLYGLSLDAIYRGRLDGLSENARKVF